MGAASPTYEAVAPELIGELAPRQDLDAVCLAPSRWKHSCTVVRATWASFAILL